MTTHYIESLLIVYMKTLSDSVLMENFLAANKHGGKDSWITFKLFPKPKELIGC